MQTRFELVFRELGIKISYKNSFLFTIISSQREMSLTEFELINDVKFDDVWETFLQSDVFDGSPV